MQTKIKKGWPEQNITNSPAYQAWLNGIAAKPNPLGRYQPGIEADPKYSFNPTVKVRPEGWLTQEKIDRLPRPPREETWREFLRDGWSTIILVIVFALGAWALFALWGMSELYQAVTAAGRG